MTDEPLADLVIETDGSVRPLTQRGRELASRVKPATVPLADRARAISDVAIDPFLNTDLTLAAHAAVGYLDGLKDRGAIDAQGIQVARTLRNALRAAQGWHAYQCPYCDWSTPDTRIEKHSCPEAPK